VGGSQARPPRQWPAPPGRASRDRSAGPVPQGAPPADGTPADPSPTGHPPASSEAPPPEPATSASGAPSGEGDNQDGVAQAEAAVEKDLSELAKVAAERDEYLDRLRRLQADFENYKKRVVKQQLEQRERAAEDLLTQLLPVLDNFDLGIAHGAEGLDPVHRSMLEVLGNVGLERLDPAGQAFDPNEHDAVLHEAADSGTGPEVVEVLRAGYRWKGRVLRPAMVKVKG
jgi:molecular chaperone GrpE